MQEFSTSLLREKFIIHDPNAEHGNRKGPIVALSNRVVVELKRDDAKNPEEVFVIRTQNMHSCVRMAARLFQSYRQGGSILTRGVPYDWAAAWDSLTNDYEFSYNPHRWIAVYTKGRILFEKGEHHPLLDVIEKCQALNKGAYDDSVLMAEDAFKKTGKVVKLEYDGNVALVVNMGPTEGRCGVILRGGGRPTTFNFVAEARDDQTINIPQCLSAAAAFLEGIQLAFMVGMNEEKIRRGLFAKKSDEAKQTTEARRRLSRLNAEIANLESVFAVRYRPERPEFPRITAEAEQLAQRILDPAPKKV